MLAIIMSGLPCAGKSTLTNIIQTAITTHAVSSLSTDGYLEAFAKHFNDSTSGEGDVGYNDMFNAGWYNVAAKAMTKHLEFASKNHLPIIWDQVNNTRKKRKETVKRLKSMGYTHIICCHLNTSYETCLMRNETRAEETGKYIPLSEMDRMYQATEEPFMDVEGFDSVFTIEDFSMNSRCNVVSDLVTYCLAVLDGDCDIG